MSGPPLPPPFDEIGQRCFSFYPSIVNAEPNEWRLRSATWSDVQVINARTHVDVWIPRQYIGLVSETDDPVLILGLTKELEYKDGAVWPRIRRVIEIPRAVNAGPHRLNRRFKDSRTPAPVVGIRLDTRENSRASRLLVIYAGVAAVLVSLLVLVVFRDWIFSARIANDPLQNRDLGLTAADDFDSVVQRLGPPSKDQWRSTADGTEFRALGYPENQLTVILMGRDRGELHYIGAMGPQWRVMDSVPLNRGDSWAILSTLPKF
ncbi:MAG TPA: hypothetical protein VJ323_17620 [Bryobacteraceae bacterium]|nr:hypothetical protein [Bryobacteraceae bacterium]